MPQPAWKFSTNHASSNKVAMIGSGAVGVALAKRLIAAGYSVSLSNSRGPQTLQRQEQETGAQALDAVHAVTKADIVILAVPLSSMSALAATLRPVLRESVMVIDTGNYYPSRDGRIEELDEGLPDTSWISHLFSVPVAKAFNSIIAANIVTNARRKNSPERSTLPVSADDPEALEVAMTVVEDVGFNAYNAGTLADSWRYQPGQPAYCVEPNLEQLIMLLSKANQEQGPVNRDKARAMIEKLPPDLSPQTLLRVARLSVGLDRWNVSSWIAAVSFAATLLRASIRS